MEFYFWLPMFGGDFSQQMLKEILHPVTKWGVVMYFLGNNLSVNCQKYMKILGLSQHLWHLGRSEFFFIPGRPLEGYFLQEN